jgi:hypothetical protein
MHTSTTRFLTGLISLAALGLGVVGAAAEGANGPDAGIGIAGYDSPYNNSADGIGPGWRRNAPEQQYQDSSQRYNPHDYRPY